jgi:ABC-2 type transport system ATP-binding protein
MMGDDLIEFKGVTKTFGKNRVLDDINFSIPERKITGIMGASGEGKSTILKMIISFYKPTKGKILYKGKSIRKSKKILSKMFGLSIEEGSFYENLTVYENLLHFGRLYGVRGKLLRKRASDILSLVGLKNAEKTIASNLSLGMKKRLDIGCSLVHNPSILILDEPTADLDPLLRRQMVELVKAINSHGTTVILTTQLLDEFDEACEKIVILFNEKIIEQDSPSKIKKKYKASSLTEVFNDIFSKKSRKAYQESSEKKSKFKLKKDKEIKKSLIASVSKIDELIEKAASEHDADYFLKEIREEKKDD